MKERFVVGTVTAKKYMNFNTDCSFPVAAALMGMLYSFHQETSKVLQELTCYKLNRLIAILRLNILNVHKC